MNYNMKKLFLSVVLLAGCQAAPVVVAPVPAVPVGFTFSTPCEVHGEDTWTVQGVSTSFVYTFTNTIGQEVTFDEKHLLEAFQELGITLDKQ